MKKIWIFLLGIVFFQGALHATAKTVRNTHFRYSIDIPDRMMKIEDTADGVYQQLYYDTTAGIIFIISARESKFRSVADYIDCGKEGLEQAMKVNYGDSMLTLIRCIRSPYYPNKTTVLHFKVTVLPFGFDRYIVYFIHHRHKDLQLSFTYKYDNEEASMTEINKIIATLKLE